MTRVSWRLSLDGVAQVVLSADDGVEVLDVSQTWLLIAELAAAARAARSAAEQAEDEREDERESTFSARRDLGVRGAT